MKHSHYFVTLFDFAKKIVLLACVMYFLYLSFLHVVSHGTMDLSVNEAMNSAYTNMWQHFLQGRYDVDPHTINEKQALAPEGFYRNGKTYASFGPFPMFMRGLMKILTNSDSRDWARFMVVVAALITVSFSTLAYFKVASKSSATTFTKVFYTTLFGLSMSYGSIVISILSSAYIFHESAMWGLAWACVFVWGLVSFLSSEEVKPKYLFFMSIGSGFSLLSRGTTAIGPVLITTTVIIFIIILSFCNLSNNNSLICKVTSFLSHFKKPITKKTVVCALLAAIIPLLLCSMFQIKVNYERWGNPLEFYPLKYYGLMLTNKSRYEAVKESGTFNIKRIPCAFSYYFIPTKNYFVNKFPYIDISGHNELFSFLNHIHFDFIELGNPLPINSFYLICMVILGGMSLYTTYSSFGIIIGIVFLMSTMIILSYCCLSLRYSVDFIPLLVFLAIPSSKSFISLENKIPKLRILLKSIALLLVIVSIFLGTMTMYRLKSVLGNVPLKERERIANFFDLGNILVKERFIGLFDKSKPLEVLRYNTNKNFPAYPSKGQIWSPDFDKTIFWFDGKNWTLIKDDQRKYYGAVSMRIRFKPQKGHSEPILTTGAPGKGDSVYVQYLSEKEIKIGFDCWGRPGIISDLIKIEPGHIYFLEVSLGSFYSEVNLGTLNSNVIVKLDGKLILNSPFDFHKTTYEQIKIGKNEIGSSVCGPIFNGEIEGARRLGLEIPVKK